MRPRAGLWLIGTLLVLAFASPAQAITPTITEFSNGLSSSDNPFDIASGADANLWFTDAGSARAIGRITPVGQITKFTTGLGGASSPKSIAAGADGNLWFTDAGSPPAIGRVDAAGGITEFTSGLSSGSVLDGIAAGPDGNVWFADHGPTPAIGRVTSAGAIHEFTLPAGSSPNGVAGGPDGNVWFTDAGVTPGIGRITPAGTVHEFTTGLKPGSTPALIAAGPDGNLWFTDEGTTPAIGRITPAGVITEFTTGLAGSSYPVDIVSGADGALWFTDQGTNKPAIGRVLPNGAIAEFSTGLPSGSTPPGIAAGPDGNVWFTDDSNTSPAIGMITTPPTTTTASATATGATTAAVLGIVDGHAQATRYYVEYGALGGTLSTTGTHGLGVTVGPTHVTLPVGGLRPNTTYQARMVGVNDTDATPGDFVTFTTGPAADRITRMTLRPKTFVAARSGPTVRSARAPGALISYTGSQPATTRFTVEHAVQGRHRGKSCVRRTRGNRRARPCTLYVTVGSFTHPDAAGHVRFRFTGRLHHRTLPPGNYRLNAEPHSAGGVGRVVSKSFTIKAPPRRHKKKG